MTKPNTISDSSAEARFARHPRAIYPWQLWFDGKPRQLFLRQHFPRFKNLKNAVCYIRNVARRLGLQVQIRTGDNGGILIRARLHKNGQDEHEASTEA